MSKYNRWRRRARRKKTEKVIHRITRKTSSENIRNRAIELLDEQRDHQARLQSESPPPEEESFKIMYKLLHLISEEEILNTTGDKKFRAQKMAYYEEKLWDLYCELNDLVERLRYLNEHAAKIRDRRPVRKNIKAIKKKIKKLKKAYRKVKRRGFLGLFKPKADHSDDFILERDLPSSGDLEEKPDSEGEKDEEEIL